MALKITFEITGTGATSGSIIWDDYANSVYATALRMGVRLFVGADTESNMTDIEILEAHCLKALKNAELYRKRQKAAEDAAANGGIEPQT